MKFSLKLLCWWYDVYWFLMSSTKVPPKCRWTEQHSGNNRIYFQWMHSGIKKKGRADLKAEIFWIAMVTWTEHPRELSDPCWWNKAQVWESLAVCSFPTADIWESHGKKYFLSQHGIKMFSLVLLCTIYL